MEIHFAFLEEILPLRESVIIAGTGRVSAFFPGDTDSTTRHVGVFAEGRCIGCATFLRSEWEGEPAWQLRGMATDPQWRGRGTGRSLLEFAQRELESESGIGFFWCNARESALGFYRKLGVIGAETDKKTAKIGGKGVCGIVILYAATNAVIIVHFFGRDICDRIVFP